MVALWSRVKANDDVLTLRASHLRWRSRRSIRSVPRLEGENTMVERAPFLSSPYSAYHHRERPAEDQELTRVGPGTPCGEYLRRFWQPIILSSELGELPRRIRILGEDLVVFRDKRGVIGLLELYCPHRGTSLEFG